MMHNVSEPSKSRLNGLQKECIWFIQDTMPATYIAHLSGSSEIIMHEKVNNNSSQDIL